MIKVIPALLIALCMCSCGTGEGDNEAGCSVIGNQNAVNCNSSDSLITQDNSAAESSEDSEILSFVWKPESESDGNLVVLINPLDATVRVTGSISETLVNSGASNGFGTTARGTLSGCDYGQGVIVEFFSSEGKQLRTSGGNLSITIPDGCNRYELE